MADAPTLTGTDHVTDVCTDVKETRAFYEEVLGFETVERTENYDDSGTPHYYFAPSRPPRAPS